METLEQRIEAGYHKEASLFEDLLHCLDSERENLISLNLENLWTLMEKKQSILESIEGVQHEIKQMLDGKRERQPVSPEEKHLPASLADRVTRLKEDVRCRVKENVLFIQETLGFFEEMIQVFLSKGEAVRAYAPGSKKTVHAQPLVLYKEV